MLLWCNFIGDVFANSNWSCLLISASKVHWRVQPTACWYSSAASDMYLSQGGWQLVWQHTYRPKGVIVHVCTVHQSFLRVSLQLHKWGGGRGAAGARIEAPKAPRGGMWGGVPLPPLGEGLAPPQKFFWSVEHIFTKLYFGTANNEKATVNWMRRCLSI